MTIKTEEITKNYKQPKRDREISQNNLEWAQRGSTQPLIDFHILTQKEQNMQEKNN